MRKWLRRLARQFSGERLDREVRAELEMHVELEIADRMSRGATAEEARRTTLRDFGPADRWREEARTSYRVRWLDEVRQDLRYAARVLRSSPAFALAAVATLALGIGANTAVFSTVRGVLLTPLPYPGAERLVRLYEYRQSELASGSDARGTISYLNLSDLRAQSELWESAAAYDEWSVTLSGLGDAERYDGAAVDWSWFDVLGVEPAAGRFFTAADSTSADAQQVVLDWALWQERFGGRHDVIGSSITLNGLPYAVIGVAPQGLEDPGLQGASFGTPRLWRPPIQYFTTNSRGSRSFTALVRLQQGVTLARAQAELDALQAGLVAQYPENNAGRVARLVPLATDMTGRVRDALLLTLAAAGVVLLVACANVANLLLLRAAARSREMSLRGALGASRLRVMRQLVTESLMLSVLGGACGVVLAAAAMPVLRVFAAGHLPRSAHIGIDGGVLATTMALTLGVGLVFGLVPAIEMSRSAPGAALRAGGRITAGGRSTRHLLLGVQVALCVIALASAALLTRTLMQLRAVDTGMNAENVLTLELRPSVAAWPVERYSALHEELRRSIGELPGVRAVGATGILPMSGGFNGVGYSVQGQPPPAEGQGPTAEARAVTPGFFEALSIPLLAGRALADSDAPDRDTVIVVSRALAERHFGSAAAAVGGALIRNDQLLRIVGVVGDIQHFTLDQEPQPAIYMPDAQAPEWMRYPLRLVIRADRDPTTLVPAIRSIARALDSRMPVSQVTRMSEVVGATYAGQRARSLLFGGFAAITLLLATVGVYGTVAYDVARRRQEIGVRMALGANRGSVAFLLLRQSMRPVVLGAIVGVAAALATGRLLANLLLNVSSADPLALALAPLVLLSAAAVAAWWPARRAAGIAPGAVLRED